MGGGTLRHPRTVREKSELVLPEKIDLVICPCTVFDEEGSRMGMGAGYYDRFLPLCSQWPALLRPLLSANGCRKCRQMNGIGRWKEFLRNVLEIRKNISYEGEDVRSLIRNFHEAVDGYLADCSKTGTEPEKAYKGTFNVRVSENLHREAALYGLNNNMSLNSIVENALQNMVEKNFYHTASMVREDTRDFYYRESKTDHDSGELFAGESKNIEIQG